MTLYILAFDDAKACPHCGGPIKLGPDHYSTGFCRNCPYCYGTGHAVVKYALLPQYVGDNLSDPEARNAV